MSLPDTKPLHLIRSLALVCVVLTLAACSFAPVYSSGARDYNLQFASPESRIEQIVYQDLVTRFGRSTSPDALLVTVSVSSASLLGTTLEGLLTITRPDPTGLTEGEELYRVTRTASASSGGGTQQIASQRAGADAAERAAHQLAESIRLTLLAVLTEDGSVSPGALAAQ